MKKHYTRAIAEPVILIDTDILTASGSGDDISDPALDDVFD